MDPLLLDSILLLGFSLLRFFLGFTLLLPWLLLLCILLFSEFFVACNLECFLYILLDSSFLLRVVHFFVSRLGKFEFLLAFEDYLALDLGLVECEQVRLTLDIAIDMDTVAV